MSEVENLMDEGIKAKNQEIREVDKEIRKLRKKRSALGSSKVRHNEQIFNGF